MTALLTLLEKLWLNTKLMLGFSIGLLIAAAIGAHSLSTLSAYEAEMDRLYEVELLGISHIKEANINLIYMGRALRHSLIAQDEATRDKARAQVALAHENLRRELNEARKYNFRPETIARFEQFERHFKQYSENIEHAVGLIGQEKINPSQAAKFITSPEFMAVVNAVDDDLTALSRIKERGSQDKIQALRAQSSQTRRDTLLLIFVGLVLAIGLGIVIGNSIKQPSQRLQRSVEGLARGDVSSPIPHTDYPNEIGILARAIQILQGTSRKTADTHWVKAHAAEIATELQHADQLKDLVQIAISRIATVLNAGHGVIYVADGDGRLNLMASYGHRERKQLNNSLTIGEGLIGQCAMEKSAITLTAPKDYIMISSGLGEAVPNCIAVLPILHNENLLGVLEIASFQQFTERETALLDALMPTLATSMEIIKRNQRTRELLASTQEQAERMEKQAAQLEEQSVEMEAQQAELMETENWFRSIIETAPDGMLVVNESSTIVLSNPQAANLLGYDADQLLGMSLREILPTSISDLPNSVACAVQARHKDSHAIDLTLNVGILPSVGKHGRCISLVLRAAL